MRISLLNLLLIIAVAAMATALYSFKRSADSEHEALKQKTEAWRKSFEAQKLGELAKSQSESRILQNLSGLPSLTDYGRIRRHLGPRGDSGTEYHHILAVLDPRKNYAVFLMRRWGSDEARGETKRQELELVIEAAPANLFVNRMLVLRILATPAKANDAAQSEVFAGDIRPILALHESEDTSGMTRRSAGDHVWCEALRQLKVSKTSLVKRLEDSFNLESKIQQRPTQLCWITGQSDETNDLQSIYVTIEELTPERLTELSAAPRFHEYKHPVSDP